MVKVNSDGGFKGNPSDANNVDQVITVAGVDLLDGFDDVNTALQSMVEAGKLITD
jgi:hypothetical protein